MIILQGELASGSVMVRININFRFRFWKWNLTPRPVLPLGHPLLQNHLRECPCLCSLTAMSGFVAPRKTVLRGGLCRAHFAEGETEA